MLHKIKVILIIVPLFEYKNDMIAAWISSNAQPTLRFGNILFIFFLKIEF